MYSNLTLEQQTYIDSLISDKSSFDEFVYTPWRDAVEELHNRQNNTEIDSYIEKILPNKVPYCMKGKQSMVLCRSIATPNFETQRFLMCADVLTTLQPLILEYTDDKFVGVNETKKALGKLSIYLGREDVANPKIKHIEIIDFTEAQGKKISSIYTDWGQSLVEFHHEMLFKAFPQVINNVHEMSDWLHQIGRSSTSYYKGVLSLFLKQGILFENYLTSKNDFSLTKNIVLPTIIEIKKELGIKPLIVSLDPLDTEGDKFWLSYPSDVIETVNNKRT